MINKHKKSQIIEQKLKVELRSYIDSLSKEKIQKEERINQIDDYKWVSTNEQKNTLNSFKKYSFASILFICGLILVSIVKNDTRSLQKEIDIQRSSINLIKYNLNQATLDNEVITSPENISRLANEYLNNNLTYYKRSQIFQISDTTRFILKPVTKPILEDKSKETVAKKAKVKENLFSIKSQVAKKIEQKKVKLEKIKDFYSEPKLITTKIKKKVAKKKGELVSLYNSPKAVRWGVVQVVKAALGIPPIPGR